MSFSKDVKDELIKVQYEKPCCKRSVLYGLCLFGRAFSSSGVMLQTEHRGVAELYASLLGELFNIKADITPTPKERSYNVHVAKRADCEKLIKAFGHADGESLRINHSNFYCESCTGAFMAGAFLASGTVSSPNKDYHLEFTIPYYNLSKSLQTLLAEKELQPKYARRKGYNIIYFKESEAIENCLYIMGAHSAMFDMMNIKIVKDFRNKANRKANCENANINKMVEAAAVQINAVEKIWRIKGRDYLPQNLEKIAELRYENPDLSLGELAELSPDGLSRSGINHRLNKIIEIAKKLDNSPGKSAEN
ncbi:MAG: DNA-binding protein WhiA [Clostridiales bacterium]|nr:DNA-binding protein WhiA [Clostridiales bacterium]